METEKSKLIMFFSEYLSNPKEEHGSQPIIKRLQTLIMREELNISDVVKELVKQLDFCREELSKCIASSVYPKIITHNKQEVVNSSDPHEIQTITRIDEYFKSKTAEQLVEIAEKYDLIDRSEEKKTTNPWIKVSDIDITTLTGHVYWAKLYRGGVPITMDLRNAVDINGHLHDAYSFNFMEAHVEYVMKIEIPNDPV